MADKRVTVKVDIQKVGGIDLTQDRNTLKAVQEQAEKTAVAVANINRGVVAASLAATTALRQQISALTELGRLAGMVTSRMPQMQPGQPQTPPQRTSPHRPSEASAAIIGAVAAVGIESMMRPEVRQPLRTTPIQQGIGQIARESFLQPRAIQPMQPNLPMTAVEISQLAMREAATTPYPSRQAAQKRRVERAFGQGDLPFPEEPPEEDAGGAPVEPSPTGPKPKSGLGSMVSSAAKGIAGAALGKAIGVPAGAALPVVGGMVKQGVEVAKTGAAVAVELGKRVGTAAANLVRKPRDVEPEVMPSAPQITHEPIKTPAQKIAEITEAQSHEPVQEATDAQLDKYAQQIRKEENDKRKKINDFVLAIGNVLGGTELKKIKATGKIPKLNEIVRNLGSSQSYTDIIGVAPGMEAGAEETGEWETKATETAWELFREQLGPSPGHAKNPVKGLHPLLQMTGPEAKKKAEQELEDNRRAAVARQREQELEALPPEARQQVEGLEGFLGKEPELEETRAEVLELPGYHAQAQPIAKRMLKEYAEREFAGHQVFPTPPPAPPKEPPVVAAGAPEEEPEKPKPAAKNPETEEERHIRIYGVPKPVPRKQDREEPVVAQGEGAAEQKIPTGKFAKPLGGMMSEQELARLPADIADQIRQAQGGGPPEHIAEQVPEEPPDIKLTKPEAEATRLPQDLSLEGIAKEESRVEAQHNALLEAGNEGLGERIRRIRDLQEAETKLAHGRLYMMQAYLADKDNLVIFRERARLANELRLTSAQMGRYEAGATRQEIGSATHISAIREEMQLRKDQAKNQRMETRVGRELEFGKISVGLSDVADKMEMIGKVSTKAFAISTAAILGFVRAGSPEAFSTLTGNFQLLAGTIGNQFIPHIITAADWLGKARGWVNSLGEETKAGIAKWTMYGVAALGVGTILGRLAPIARLAASGIGLLYAHPVMAGIIGVGGAIVYLLDKIGILRPAMEGLGNIGQHIGQSLSQLSTDQIVLATGLGSLGMAFSPLLGRFVATRQAAMANSAALRQMAGLTGPVGGAMNRLGSSIGNVGLALAGLISHPWVAFGAIVVGTLAVMTNGFGFFGNSIKEVNQDLRNTVNALHNIDRGRDIVRAVRAEQQSHEEPSRALQRQRLEAIREVIGPEYYGRLIAMGQGPGRENWIRNAISMIQAQMPNAAQIGQMASRVEQIRQIPVVTNPPLVIGAETRTAYAAAGRQLAQMGIRQETFFPLLQGQPGFNREQGHFTRDEFAGNLFSQLYRRVQKELQEAMPEGQRPSHARVMEQLANRLGGREIVQKMEAFSQMLEAFGAINPIGPRAPAATRPAAAAGLAGAVGMGFGPLPGLGALVPSPATQAQQTQTERLISMLPRELQANARALLFMEMQPRQIEIDALHDIVQNESIRAEGQQELMEINLDGFRRVVAAIERLYAIQNQGGGGQMVAGVGMNGAINWSFGGSQ